MRGVARTCIAMRTSTNLSRAPVPSPDRVRGSGLVGLRGRRLDDYRPGRIPVSGSLRDRLASRAGRGDRHSYALTDHLECYLLRRLGDYWYDPKTLTFLLVIEIRSSRGYKAADEERGTRNEDSQGWIRKLSQSLSGPVFSVRPTVVWPTTRTPLKVTAYQTPVGWGSSMSEYVAWHT